MITSSFEVLFCCSTLKNSVTFHHIWWQLCLASGSEFKINYCYWTICFSDMISILGCNSLKARKIFIFKKFSCIEPLKFHGYNPFLVYCRELAPGTVGLTGDRAQGDDSQHDSHYTFS